MSSSGLAFSGPQDTVKSRYKQPPGASQNFVPAGGSCNEIYFPAPSLEGNDPIAYINRFLYIEGFLIRDFTVFSFPAGFVEFPGLQGSSASPLLFLTLLS